MIGNEAVARGIFEAGVKVVSSYPGTPSTEITEFASKYSEFYSEWAPNEKVALEVAAGASIAGARSFCGMKHVGLNVAADPLFTLSYTGVNGGLVIGVADDPGMHSSQNEQDSRNYAKAAKIPMLEPADSAECCEFTKLAYEISEKYDTPVLLRLTTRVAHSQSLVQLSEREERELLPYEKMPGKYIMAPAAARVKHPVVEQRTLDLAEYSDTSDVNRVEYYSKKIGIIASGAVYEYAKEVMGENASYLKIGMPFPLPKNKIKEFAANVDKLYVIEELDSFIEDYVKTLGIEVCGKDIFPVCGEIFADMIAEKLLGKKPEFEECDEEAPVRPPVLCPGCPHRGVFYILAKKKLYVSGDIGCYTLGGSAPLSALDTTICMGASVSALHGRNIARRGESEKKSVAVIGDSTFVHSGITGLIDIAYNGTNSTVLILDNSITGMTGHQNNPTNGLTIKNEPATAIDIPALCKAIGISHVQSVDPYDLKAFEKALDEALATEAPSVIIAKRPCALLKYVKAKPAYKVNPDKCKACKMCMKIGCTPISFVDGKAKIDDALCVGCGLCADVCPFGAIEE
ncbi:MAG: indolepyruvate ferredoxin oxidoreductase subunit alpha [Ruminococcaceae bacterium]|nr:indolepyruvate ferredoxin oxidoreductase subunit alpha [Oscillospiraceae bacterium]